LVGIFEEQIIISVNFVLNKVIFDVN